MSKRLLSIIICFVLLFSAAPSVMAENDTAYKEFYVSPSGNDAAAGTEDAPFLTIERAREEVRKYTEAMNGDIYVYLRGGEYYVNDTISFGDQDGGNNGYNVYYKNYPGEEPIIYGGQRVTGWRKYKGNIYRAKLDIDADIYNLSENLERSIEACFPNEDDDASKELLTVAQGGKTSGVTATIFYNPEDIDENIDFSDVRVRYHAQLQYGSHILPVVDIDRKANVLTVDITGAEADGTSETHRLQAFDGCHYKLIGALDFLDMPGEFYVDRDGGWVYYWPRSSPIENQTVVAPTVKRIFDIGGADFDHIVRNIYFEGLTVSTTNGNDIILDGHYCEQMSTADAAFFLQNAQNIHIENCRIMNSALSAVRMHGWAQDNVVSGNYIKNAGISAVTLKGYHTYEAYGIFDNYYDAYCNKRNIVHNNFIRNVGYDCSSGYGIAINESGENKITHNEISKGPRFAIGMLCILPERGGKTWWGMETKETGNFNDGFSQDFRLNQHNYIAFNDVYDFERFAKDGGVIYSNSSGRGNRFYNNMVHDNYSAYDDENRFYPVYNDGSSQDWRTNNNIVYNNAAVGGGGTGLLLNTAVQNEDQNNVVDITNGTVSGYGVNSTKATFNYNILYAGDKRDISIAGIGLANPWSMDNNMYYAADGEMTYNDIIGPDTFESRQATGFYEQESLLGVDPMFVDPENHDYRLKSESPALKIGIKSIDQAAIGVTKDFMWRVDQPIQGKNFSESDGIDRQLRISNTKDGGWAKFADVSFNHIKSNEMWLTYRPQAGGTVEIRLDSPDGQLISSYKIENYVDNSYKTVTAEIPKISGVHDVYVVFRGNAKVCEVDKMRFGSSYDALPDIKGITEKLRAEGKAIGGMVLSNAGETEKTSTITDKPGNLTLMFKDAELASTTLVGGAQDSVGGFDEGEHLGFSQVEMDNIKRITIKYGVSAIYAGATLEFRLDSVDGPIIGTAKTKATHPTSFVGNFEEMTLEVTPTTGVHDIYMTSEGKDAGVGNFIWMRVETDTGVSPVKHNKVIVAEGVEPVGIRTLGDLRVVAGGFLLTPNEPIYKKDGVVMTPIKDTVSKLGYSWNEEECAISDKEGNKLKFNKNSDIAYVNGIAHKISTTPDIKSDGSWWIPSDVFKLLGDYVDYIELSGYVRILDVNEKIRQEDMERRNSEERNLAYFRWGNCSSRAVETAPGIYTPWAFDGDSNTFWAENSRDDGEGWIYVDLQKSYPVSRVALNFQRAPQSFNVYVSNDDGLDKKWTKVATVDKVQTTMEIEFPPVYAKYVKLGDLYRTDNQGTAIKEFEVYQK